jgi:hypothetical protein
MADELIRKLRQLLEADLQTVSAAASIEQLVEHLQRNQQITQLIQNNSGNAVGFQTLVSPGAVANLGIHLHDWDPEKLTQVLRVFLKSLQPKGIPNNVPRSGVAKFIGREQEVEQLHTQLQQGNLDSIAAVEGMGGVGKTELAIQYTRQFDAVYTGGICWLFAREFNIGTQIVGFAKSQLNLKIPEGLELLDQVAYCWRNWPEGKVLLVLDDVVNYGRDISPYLPPPTSNRFKVLMTTRLKFGPPIQPLLLDVLPPEQTLELLTVVIGKDRIQAELAIAKTLCSWLGYLPLAVELVGRYLLQRPTLLLAELLLLLREKAKQREAIRHNALNRDEATGTSTTKQGVAAAFELSWDELDPDSRHLGKLLSLFAPTPIPWRLVESVEQKYFKNSGKTQKFDVEVFETSRFRLQQLHLLQLSQQQQQIYRLHPLIREFFGSKLEEESNIASQNSEK